MGADNLGREGDLSFSPAHAPPPNVNVAVCGPKFGFLSVL